jgi:lipid-A-disaccharide synthase
VIQEVLPGQLEVAAVLRKRFDGLGLMISAADARAEAVIAPILGNAGMDIPVYAGRHRELINAADLVLVASGTAAVETAYYHKPMIVMYNVSRIGYHLVAPLLVSTKYFCMVNILAGREIVPEFIPYFRNTEPIAAKAVELLACPERRERMSAELAELIAPRVKTGASDNAAAEAIDLLDANERPRTTPAGSRHIIW